MPRNTSVSLGDHFASFIDTQVGDAIIGVLFELAEPLVCTSEELFPSHAAITISNMSWATACIRSSK